VYIFFLLIPTAPFTSCIYSNEALYLNAAGTRLCELLEHVFLSSISKSKVYASGGRLCGGDPDANTFKLPENSVGAGSVSVRMGIRFSYIAV